MPTITIDPGTITTPEEWLKAWQYAVFTLHITAAKVTPPPQTPEGYAELVEMINEELARRTGGLLYYGSQSFPPVTSSGSTILSAVQATDPSIVNTLSASPIDDIVTTGTSVGTVVATTATGSYSYAKRGVAIAAALSILGATLFAAQLTPEDKEDLEFTVEPFTDENGNVICYTDEEGTTYLPEDFIEAIRQKLIQAGVYSGITPTPPPASDSFELPIRPLTAQQWMNLGDTYLKTAIEYALAEDVFDLSGTFYVECSVINSSLTNRATYIFYRTADRNIITVNKDSTYGTSAIYGGSITLSDRIQNPEISDRNIVYNFNSGTCDVGGGGGNTRPYQFYVPPASVSPYTLQSITFLYSPYGITGGDGIPGIETDPNATLPSDAGRLMSDYFADWYDNKKIFKTIEQDEDGNITGIGDVTFLPAGLTDTHGLDEDTTQTQSEAQDGDPVTDPSKLDDLLPAIKEFFDIFIPTDPDTPSPTIPVEDSGDSPTPTPPLITGAGSDLIAIYNPTKEQIQAFNQFLWSLDPTQLVNWKKVFINPIEAVISLQMIYVTPITGETRNIKCGYIETNVPSKIVTNQYKDVDCGTVDLVEFYSNVWDYVDTQISIYLPFIGIVPLDTREVMGSILHVKYRVDVYTGTCLAQIIVTKQNSTAVLYTFPGNCSVQLPITSGQFSAMWGAMIGAIGIGIGGMVAGIPGAGVMADSYAASKLMSSSGVAMQRSGSIGSNAGAMGSRVPYLIITHPVPYDARDYNTQYGFPLNQTTRIGDVNGYTRIKDVHLSGIPCTDDELEQIERLLKDGVIVN